MTAAELHDCPCCGLPTLEERGVYEICPVCWWEDDGQDDPQADEVRGGPNKGYSLAAARKNFRDHGHMYDRGQGIDVVERPSDARQSLLRYVDGVRQGETALDRHKLLELISQPNAAKARTPRA